MTRVTAPILIGALTLLVVYAFLAPRASSDREARRHGIAIAAAVFLVTCALVVVFFTLESPTLLVDPFVTPHAGGTRPVFGLDGLSIPLLPLGAAVPLAVLVGAPRAQLDRYRVRTILLTEASMLAFFTALDLAVLAACWIAMLVPAWLDARREGDPVLAHTLSRYQGPGVAALLSATVLLGTSHVRDGLATTLVLRDLAAHDLPADIALAVALLLAAAVVVRGSLFPAHAFWPTLFERGSAGVASILFVAQPGAYLVARVMLELLPGIDPLGLSLVASLGLFTAAWGALLALAQHDLRRFVGALATSQSGSMLAALASANAGGFAGGLVYWMASSLALAGLALVVAMVRARTGTSDVRALGGLAKTMPRATTLFLVLGVSAIGLPGTLSFVGEDLLVHGIIESHPLAVAAQLLATALNGVAFFRIYTEGFVGATRRNGVTVPAGRDLSPRERFAAVAVVIALVVFGLFPRDLVHTRERAAGPAVSLAAENRSAAPLASP
jgi:NADH-quinone oxidoreductase subunit M